MFKRHHQRLVTADFSSVVREVAVELFGPGPALDLLSCTGTAHLVDANKLNQKVKSNV